MTDINVIVLKHGSFDFDTLLRMLVEAEESEKDVHLRVTPASTREVYLPGDLIECKGDDNQWHPARVRGESADGVSIDYGPRFKHHATVSRYAVRTDRIETTPARLAVVEIQ